MKPSRSDFPSIRGLRYHVRVWGDDSAPKLFMLHGWMDVSASFQFLVDALERDWCVLAPDWRGFGLSEWCPQGYWFPDYIADLEAVLDAYAPDEPVSVVGHSLGGIVAGLYAGIRPRRVHRAVSLDGFGIPAESSGRAPDKYAAWLDALRDPPVFTTYADLSGVADRLQKNNSRLTRSQAEFLATHWAEALPDGRARLRSDPKHKLPFPTVYRAEEVLAIWARATAPMLWVGAAHSSIRTRITQHDKAGEDSFAHRKAAWRNLRYIEIADAGHMLHHDQPKAVAAAIEPFLEASM
jgi:pimeloyl-ACP methyl ester carboxylesterase